MSKATEYLTVEEEKKLAARVQEGDVAARNELILSVTDLVHSLVWYPPGTPEAEDAFQVAILALIQKAPSFDPDRARWAAFAKMVANQAISAFAAEEAAGTGHRDARALTRYRKLQAEYVQEQGREPAKRELAPEVFPEIGEQLAVDKLNLLLGFAHPISWDQPLGESDDGEPLVLGDIHPDPDAISEDEILEAVDLERLKDAEEDRILERVDTERLWARVMEAIPVAGLTERQWYAIQARFGLDGQGIRTFSELAEEMADELGTSGEWPHGAHEAYHSGLSRIRQAVNGQPKKHQNPTRPPTDSLKRNWENRMLNRLKSYTARTRRSTVPEGQEERAWRYATREGLIQEAGAKPPAVSEAWRDPVTGESYRSAPNFTFADGSTDHATDRPRRELETRAEHVRRRTGEWRRANE